MASRLIEQGVRRREQMYDFIATYHGANGYAPSISEIASECKLSLNAVRGHLAKMQAEGWIDMTPRIARSIVPKL